MSKKNNCKIKKSFISSFHNITIYKKVEKVRLSKKKVQCKLKYQGIQQSAQCPMPTMGGQS